MNSLLDALQEGRLLELPEGGKEQSLRFLAHMIEAIPSLPPGTDVAGMVLARENMANTCIGMGWACPHARIGSEGDMLCAVGWSPTGIDFGIADLPPVRMIAMYLVPSNQKNLYLKEVSMLVKALTNEPALQRFDNVADLNAVRNRLLDLVTRAKEIAGPDTRARMIKLETREAAQAAVAGGFGLEGMSIEPVVIVGGAGLKPIVLTQNRELLDCLDKANGLVDSISQQPSCEQGGWRVLKRSATPYQGDRFIYDCLAVRTESKAKNHHG